MGKKNILGSRFIKNKYFLDPAYKWQIWVVS